VIVCWDRVADHRHCNAPQSMIPIASKAEGSAQHSARRQRQLQAQLTRRPRDSLRQAAAVQLHDDAEVAALDAEALVDAHLLALPRGVQQHRHLAPEAVQEALVHVLYPDQLDGHLLAQRLGWLVV